MFKNALNSLTKDNRLLWALWIAIALLMLALRPLFAPDETRYITVAWEMYNSGNYLVPHLNQETYSHKPPLMFWMINGAWATLGFGEWQGRLAIWLFYPLFILGQIALCSALFGRTHPARPLFSVLLLSNGLLLLYGNVMMFDIMLASIVTGGLWSVVRAAQTQQKRYWALYALAFGLGILAKGPAAAVHLTFAPALAFWWSRPNARWYIHWVLALIAGVGLALCWAIPAAKAGGDAYAAQIFITQSAGRMVKAFDHQQPFWWYGPVLAIVLFPFIFLPAFWRSIKNTLRVRTELPLDPQRFLLAFAVPALLIFSAISGKQVHYVLAEIPALLMLVAVAITTNLDCRPGECRGPDAVIRRHDKETKLSAIILWIVFTGVIFAALISSFSGCENNCHILSAFNPLHLAPFAALFAIATLVILFKPLPEPIYPTLLGLPAMLCLLAVIVSGAQLFQRYTPQSWAAPINEWLDAHPNGNIAFAHTYAGEFGFFAQIKQPVHLPMTMDTMQDYLAQPGDNLVIWKHKKPGIPEFTCAIRQLPFKSGTVSFLVARKEGATCPAE